MSEPITARHAAALWGVSYSTARSVLATVKPLGRDVSTGAMLYDPEEAQKARDVMPGRGTRTDLQKGNEC